MKAIQKSYKDTNTTTKTKTQTKCPKNPTCYIFEILMTYSVQIWWWIPHPGHPVHAGHPGYPGPVIKSVLQGRVYHRFGIFKLSICLQKGGVGLSRSCPSPLLAKPSQPLCGGGGGRTWSQIIDFWASQRRRTKTLTHHSFSSKPTYLTPIQNCYCLPTPGRGLWLRWRRGAFAKKGRRPCRGSAADSRHWRACRQTLQLRLRSRFIR